MTQPRHFLRVGDTFGSWTVIAESQVRISRNRTVLVRCVCGMERAVIIGQLRSGQSRSCGCTADHAGLEFGRLPRHGGSLGRRGQRHTTVLYRLWVNIKDRCFNSKGRAYKYYGGRGIKLYTAGAAMFEVFEQDILNTIGPKPAWAHSIDRIDNDGDYEPSNWRWATAKMQMNNRRPFKRLDLD
jgi:hypothetical protein